jgi:beta-lactamase superfamily II metal-dependent hydrolase
MKHFLPSALLALLLTTSVLPAAAVTPNGRLQIIHLDVGQGDGAVMISPLGQVVMFDNGTTGTGVSGLTVVEQLQALGITRVDHHFASHYHSDHIANIDEIVNAGIVIDRGWDRGGSYSSSYYTTYVNTLGSKRRTMVQNQVVTLDSLSAHPVTIKCVDLAGAGISTTDENSLCMVLKVSYGEFDMVFGGDLPGKSSGSYTDIETTVGPQVGPVEAYKVHHHGSATSSLTNWLNATQPKIAVISVGTGNSYGHPTSAALTRLHAANVRTYWTETGSGVAPNATWDKVSNGQVIISATWTAAGVDTVRGTGFAHIFTNSGVAGDVTPPVVTVSAPNAGEIWATGSVQSITWSASDNVGVASIAIHYSTNNGAGWTSIATGEANDGTYAWTVPSTPTTQALVKVTAYDAIGNTAADASNAVFTIRIPTYTITAAAGTGGSIDPSGIVTVNAGADQGFTIAPAACYSIADVLVDGSSVGAVSGHTFTNVQANHTIAVSFAIDTFTLAASTVGTGSLGTVPLKPNYDCGDSVKITALPSEGWGFGHWTGGATGSANPLTLIMTGNEAVTGVFVDIAPPTVTVDSLTGGEVLLTGAIQPITWTAVDNVGVTTVDLAYSTDGGVTYPNVIDSGLPNSGSYSWVVPDTETAQARVRVTAHDAAGNLGADASGADFEIRSPVSGVADVVLGAGEMMRVYPNPASARAVHVLCRVPQASVVNVSIFDVTGRLVRRLESGSSANGVHDLRWDGLDGSGKPVSGGIYLVRVTSDSGTPVTRRLVLIR